MGRGSTNTNKSTHPTYQIMISHAIAELKERTGSSQQAITKYIEANYVIQPETFKAQLKMAFKRLLEKGILETVKKSYKLTQAGRDEHNNEIQIVRKTPVAKPKAVVAKKVVPVKPSTPTSKKNAVKKTVVKKPAAKPARKPLPKKAPAKRAAAKK